MSSTRRLTADNRDSGILPLNFYTMDYKNMKFKIANGCDRGLCRHSCGRQDKQLNTYDWLADIPAIDLVVVDLYPFEETVASGASEQEIIEKIDIGGISLIRAGAKNFNDVVIVPSKNEYGMLQDILDKNGAQTTLEERKQFAERAFGVSSHYDTAIHQWFAK